MLDTQILTAAVGELDESTVLAILNEVMSTGGVDAGEAMTACQDGMGIIGERFESGEYFVGDLMFAGQLMTSSVEILKPAIASGTGNERGVMILCTVKNDLHDIGKNIVKAMIEANGIEVIDLGIDVPPETIVKTAIEKDIKIIGLSGVLTLATESMKSSLDALTKAGIREKVNVIIGGAPVSAEVCAYVGADAWSRNAAKGVSIILDWCK